MLETLDSSAHSHYSGLPEIHVFKNKMVFVHKQFPSICFVIHPSEQFLQAVVCNGNLVNLVFFDVLLELVHSDSTVTLKDIVPVILICCNAIHQIPKRTHDDIVWTTVCCNVCTANICFCLVDYAMRQAILKLWKLAKITSISTDNCYSHILSVIRVYQKNYLLTLKSSSFLEQNFSHAFIG